MFGATFLRQEKPIFQSQTSMTESLEQQGSAHRAGSSPPKGNAASHSTLREPHVGGSVHGGLEPALWSFESCVKEWMEKFFPISRTDSSRISKNDMDRTIMKNRIVISATEFLRPLNVALGGPDNRYGADVLLNAPPYKNVPNRADFEFIVNVAGVYLLQVEYAAKESRPVQIFLNGEMAIPNALSAPTGCWEMNCQRLLNQGRVALEEGLNVLRIERESYFPHLRRIVFVPD